VIVTVRNRPRRRRFLSVSAAFDGSNQSPSENRSSRRMTSDRVTP
jgi:hypothetical protein